MSEEVPLEAVLMLCVVLPPAVYITLSWLGVGEVVRFLCFAATACVVPAWFLLVNRLYKAAGCLLAIVGIAWAYLWTQHGPLGCHEWNSHPDLCVFMDFIGISVAVGGALIYLHGVKRDIYRRMDEQKEDILKAIEKATTGPKEE